MSFSSTASAVLISDNNNTTTNQSTETLKNTNTTNNTNNTNNTTNTTENNTIPTNTISNPKNSAEMGQTVLQEAINDPDLKFNESNDTLLITNAGSLEINNQTTEKSLESIMRSTSTLNYAQTISYGKANIIPINSLTGPLQFTFITKLTNGTILAKKFTITGNGTTYTINNTKTTDITTTYMTETQWNQTQTTLGTNTYNIISIANAWANGAPMDLLAETQTTNNITPGTITGYTMTKSILENYGESSGSEYIILTTPGGGDDDTPLYLMPWNYKYNSVGGDNPLESAYIYWNEAKKTGYLVLMKFNDKLTTQFENKTGITVINGTLSEIKFTNWILEQLTNNPYKINILTVEKAAQINQTDLNYLYGTTNKTGVGISSSGKNYIMNLTNTVTFSVSRDLFPIIDYETMKSVGEEMAEYATKVLNSLPNSNGSQIAVETAPIYASVGGKLILGFYDGISNVLNTYDPNDLLGIVNPYNYESYLNHELVAVFMQYVGVDNLGNTLVNCIELTYDFTAKSLNSSINCSSPILVSGNDTYTKYVTKTDENGNTVYDANGNTEYTLTSSSTAISNMYSATEDGFWTMPAWMRTAELWSSHPSYGLLSSWESCACCCWRPGLSLFSDYIKNLLGGLGENEEYTVTGVPYDSSVDQYSSFELSKAISSLTHDFGVSISAGTFEATQLPGGTVIVSVHNSVTGTYRTVVTSLKDMASYFRSQVIAEAQKSESNPSYMYTAAIAYLSYVEQGFTSATLSSLGQSSFSTTSLTGLTSEQLKALKEAYSTSPSAGAQWVSDYLKSIANTGAGDGSQGTSKSSGSSSGSSSDSQSSSGVSSSSQTPSEISSSSQTPSEDDSSSAQSEKSGSGQKSYEVSKTSGSSGSQSGTPLAATLGVVIITILIGVGYYFKK